MVRTTSQPQKMKIDSDRPAANALNVGTSNGLNHDHENAVGSGASPSTALMIATTAKSTSTTTWKLTRTYWNFCVVCMSR